MRIGCASHQTKRSSKCGGHDLRTRKQSNYPNQRQMHYLKSDDLKHGAQAVVIGRRFEHQKLRRVSHDRRGHW